LVVPGNSDDLGPTYPYYAGLFKAAIIINVTLLETFIQVQ